MLTLRSIIHPTDFSNASAEAFVHALRIALTAKCALTLIHVAKTPDRAEWTTFPHVRTALSGWGLASEHDTPGTIAQKLGVKIAEVELEAPSTVAGILKYLDDNPADLIVLATQGREGVARWLHGSVAEKLARQSKAPTLFVPEGARAFVDQRRGEVHLKRVLIPVDREPAPATAVNAIMGFAHMMAGIEVEERLLHIGSNPPELKHHLKPHKTAAIATRKGDVVQSILDAAAEWPPDLIGMATAGHHGFLDALRGSTTERVVRQAPCPVLAVPVA
ncbi:MAG: universal stress protein [Pseudolabrys sp.]|nr:universal stress protein [Pseudolabrys sp.]MDP2298783.1 universal stress protein [Pseudolabrys sp.]